MRRVLYISGTRADYGPARRLLQCLAGDPQLSLGILVTAMHLEPAHGETWREIARDGLEIAARVEGRVAGDSLAAMASSTGRYLDGISRTLEQIRPDIVLVLGDRGEQLAGAMAGAFQNRVVVHLCGGAVSGSIDDSIRHAITKFAHVHLPACEEHACRIRQMGEDPATVRVVGLPGGDLNPDVVFSREQICAAYELPPEKPYLLVVQHPVTQQQQEAGSQAEETLAAVAGLGYPALLANPNDDAGSLEIQARMRHYAESNPQLHLLPPPGSRERFASVMAHAGVLVGNSSSAQVEAMSVALPVVNVGTRQRGREHLACWLNVDHDRHHIRAAIETALWDETYRGRLQAFRAGMASLDTNRLVLECLKNLDLNLANRAKNFYHVASQNSGAVRQARPGGDA